MVLYVYTHLYTLLQKKKKKKYFNLHTVLYIIKDMEHLLLIYIFVKCIILKIFYYRMDKDLALK